MHIVTKKNIFGKDGNIGRLQLLCNPIWQYNTWIIKTPRRQCITAAMEQPDPIFSFFQRAIFFQGALNQVFFLKKSCFFVKTWASPTTPNS